MPKTESVIKWSLFQTHMGKAKRSSSLAVAVRPSFYSNAFHTERRFELSLAIFSRNDRDCSVYTS